MSDATLRHLERRWLQTGSADDEAAFLLRRVRSGALSPERLALAAYCGHGTCTGEPSGPTTAEAFVVGLVRWGRVASVRAAVAAFRAVPPADREAAKHAGRCVAAVSDWVDCPCDAHVKAVQSAHADLRGEGAEAAAAACLVWAVVSEAPARSASTAALAMRPLTTVATETDLVAAMRAELARWALTG
ncbi:MAG: hypothetical protein KF878_24245 [Planctomycetes bacterium]|nr:hypothetical protein [Planctomycetota bacterium]